jgi:hypothetical protein
MRIPGALTFGEDRCIAVNNFRNPFYPDCTGRGISGNGSDYEQISPFSQDDWKWGRDDNGKRVGMRVEKKLWGR